MTDTFSKQERSKIMRAVKSKGNKSTELRLIALFKQHGIKGWRRNFKLPGKPDFVFPKQRVVIFADGCFWHGHGCRNTIPSDNAAYWRAKIERNRQRDQEVTAVLTAKNWRVVRIWECEIKRGEMQKFADAGLLSSTDYAD
jgi:DNA mismatch endonuclease, patch repair protein